MNLLEYIDKGGIIVYILLVMNFIGFTIIIWKFITLPRKNYMIKKIKSKIDYSRKDSFSIQIEYEIKKLEFGLTLIKNIASISPLMGLLGTVYGILKSFEAMTLNGLGDASIFSSAISLALITTIAGLIVAIPHHLAYNHFISLIDEIELKAKKELI